MAASDDSFIREVNEALQQDRLGLLWRRYGALAIALAVGVVLATAGFVAWEAWKERRLQDQGAAFAEADALLQAKKPKEAADAYATVVADGGGGSADLARLLRADALFEAKDGAAADGALEGLAGEAGADPILRDAAAVTLAMRRLNDARPDELRAALTPLSEAGRPFRFTATELLALVDLRAGETERARGLLEGLQKAAGVPPGLKARTAELLGTLPPAPAPTPAPPDSPDLKDKP
ncbi:MAG: tetratricopeptide repeat protein [Geminicoccaceae bacterium]|nr:tetratricopeptide repeat protein [Geminicoccaceae bacterium]